MSKNNVLEGKKNSSFSSSYYEGTDSCQENNWKCVTTSMTGIGSKSIMKHWPQQHEGMHDKICIK